MPELAGTEPLPDRRDIPQHIAKVTNADAKEMTAAQWSMVQDIQRSLPEATVVVRMHEVAWKCDTKIVLSPIFGVLITQRIGPFTLRREYVAPGS